MKMKSARQERVSALVRNNALPFATVIGVITAIILGIIIRASTDPWSPRALSYLEFPGELFLRALKCLTIPLVISSMVAAVGSLDLGLSGKIGRRALIYYITTTLLAIFLGIILVLTFHPGSAESEKAKGSAPKLGRKITTPDTVMDLIRNLIPDNVVAMTFSQYATNLMAPDGNEMEKDFSLWIPRPGSSNGVNVLGIVSISIITGIVVGILKHEGKPLLLNLFNDFSELSLRITSVVILGTPVGVAFLIMPRIVAVEDAGQMFRSVGFFTLTVILGLLIHGFLFLPGIYYFITKKSPYKFIGGMSEAMLTAFGTASSTATLPASINCLEEKNKINPKIVRFVAPLGSVINMDGTALYEAVAAIFIAQSRGVPMSLTNVLVVSVTATAASIGAAGIPQAGLITMVIVLNALGLPPEDISLVFIIDWLIDRIRTPINILGDAIGSAVVEHLSRDDLDKFASIDDNLNRAKELEPEQKEHNVVNNGAAVVNMSQESPSAQPTSEHVNPAFKADDNDKL